MRDTVMELVEERLKALTSEVKRMEREVGITEELLKDAVLGSYKKTTLGKRLLNQRSTLTVLYARKMEAEQIWTLLKAHVGEVIV